MTTIGEVALWLAFLGAAWSTGAHLARWRASTVVVPPAAPVVLVVAGALLVFSWGILGGALLRGDPTLAITHEGAPIATGPLAALAALWSTRRGALLTLALLLDLCAIGYATSSERRERSLRRVGALAAATTVLLAVVVLAVPPFAPAVAATGTGTMPLHLVHWAAAAAPLLALGAVAATLVVALLVWIANTHGEHAEGSVRVWSIAAWLLATGALAVEQHARGALGLTVQDPVVLGSSRSGLVLWLVLSALLHRRVRGAILGRGAGPAMTAPGRGWYVHAAHVGAALVVASFALHVAARRVTLALPPGQSIEAADVFGRPWRLVNQGVSQFDAPTHDVTALAVQVAAPNGGTRVLSTEWRTYLRPSGEPLGGPVPFRGGWRTALQDVRIVLEQATMGEEVQVRVSFIPLAVLWPVGMSLMAVAGVAALTRRGAEEPQDAGLEGRLDG